jgi:phosphatidylglycerophosphatase A
MTKRLAILLATVGYVGHFPIAPGTAGSAAALPLYVLVRMSGSPPLEVVVILVLLAAGCWAGSVAETHYGRTDPGYVVLDEVVGMLITLLLVPVSPAPSSASSCFACSTSSSRFPRGSASGCTAASAS